MRYVDDKRLERHIELQLAGTAYLETKCREYTERIAILEAMLTELRALPWHGNNRRGNPHTYFLVNVPRTLMDRIDAALKDRP